MANVEPINTSIGNMNGIAAPQPTSNRCRHWEENRLSLRVWGLQRRWRSNGLAGWSWKLGKQPLGNCLLTRFEMKCHRRRIAIWAIATATVFVFVFVSLSLTYCRLGSQRCRLISVGQYNRLQQQQQHQHVVCVRLCLFSFSGSDSDNFACKWQTTTTWKHQLHLLVGRSVLARITWRSSRSISALALAPAFKMRCSLICW